MKNQHKRFIGVGSELMGLYINKKLNIFSKNNKYFSGISVKNELLKNFHIDMTSQIYTISKIKSVYRDGRLDSMAKLFYTRAFSWIIRVIKFTGKGYRLRKFKKSRVLEMNFNNSHVTRGLAGSSVFRRISKTEIGLVNNNKIKSKIYLKMLLSVRKLNVFTKRGLRCHKQFILKRPGKKNTN